MMRMNERCLRCHINVIYLENSSPFISAGKDSLLQSGWGTPCTQLPGWLCMKSRLLVNKSQNRTT